MFWERKTAPPCWLHTECVLTYNSFHFHSGTRLPLLSLVCTRIIKESRKFIFLAYRWVAQGSQACRLLCATHADQSDDVLPHHKHCSATGRASSADLDPKCPRSRSDWTMERVHPWYWSVSFVWNNILEAFMGQSTRTQGFPLGWV